MTRRIEPPRLNLAKLHAAGVTRIAPPNRSLAAYTFEHENVHLAIEHPSGGDSRYHVCTFSLSARVVTCAHGGYVHPFAPAVIELPTAWGTTAPREGVIGSCWHIRGRIHGIAVEFARPLELKRHIAPELLPPETADGARNAATLTGACVALLPCDLEAHLIASALDGTSMTLTQAKDSGEACDHLRKKAHDAVLIDADLEGFAATVDAVRAVPYHGPVIALTASRRSNSTEDLLSSGADAVVSRPFKPEHILTRLLALTDAACEHSGKPIPSDYATDARFAEVTQRYIEHARHLGTQLQVAIIDQQADDARKVCESLAVSGVTFGFRALTEAADAAATSLLASASVAESLPELRKLSRTIQRLVFSSEAPASGGGNEDEDAPGLAA